MRSLTLGLVVLLLSTGSATAQATIRQVDFANFTYPLSGHLLGHDRLEWLSKPAPASKHREIQLVKGSDLTKESSFVMDGKEYSQYQGFTLEGVKFADLTGDGQDDAIVVLRYYTGGTQNTNYVYIYKVRNGTPELLAYCHTGDRAYSGLYDVYASRGLLVIELADPARRSADCCSTGLVLRRFKWHDDKFMAVGAAEYRPMPVTKQADPKASTQ